LGEEIGIGLLGCGIVGSAVTRILAANADEIKERSGAHLAVKRVAVRSLAKERDVPVPRDLFTNDPNEVVDDPDVKIVVEVMAGSSPHGASSSRRWAPAGRS